MFNFFLLDSNFVFKHLIMVFASLFYLQEHFNCKNSSEDVIKIGEDVIPLAVLLNRVLGGQGDTAQDDDDHDERFEARNRHNPVN